MNNNTQLNSICLSDLIEYCILYNISLMISNGQIVGLYGTSNQDTYLTQKGFY